MISSQIKQGLYTFDYDQTYDLLWWDNLHQNHKSLLSLVWLNHWIFSPDYQDFYPILIERFTPWGYAWADNYSYNLWAFLAPLTRYGVLEVPELSGARWGFDNPTNLQFPESISYDVFPDEITLNIPANESVVITWLEYDQGNFIPYPIHPNIDASIVIIRKNYNFFKASKSARSIKINTSKWLVNSAVITGNCSIPEDNGTLLYSDQMSRLTGIVNQLDLPYPRIIKSFNITASCTQKIDDARFFWARSTRNSLEVEWGDPSFSIPLWQNVPEWYFWAGVSFANNNYWQNGQTSSNDVGYPLSPFFDSQSNIISLEKWYLGETQDENLTSITIPSWDHGNGDQIFFEWNGYRWDRRIQGLDFGFIPPFRYPHEINYYSSVATSPIYDVNEFKVQTNGKKYINYSWGGGISDYGLDSMNNCSSFLNAYIPISGLDFRLISYVKSFFYSSFVIHGEIYNGDQTWEDPKYGWITSESSLFVVEQSREFSNNIWRTNSLIQQFPENEFLFPVTLIGLIGYRTYAPNTTKILTITQPIEFTCWFNPPAANWQYDQATFQSIRDTLDNVEFDPTNYVMPDSVRIKEIHAALQADKYSKDDADPSASRVQNLGRQIEQISQVLGLNFNSDGTIRSVRQSKWIPQGGTLPAGWPIGQWGRNTGGSSDGQQGGLDTEDRLGMAYEVRGNRFEISEKTGEVTKIEEGGYVLIENWPQLFHIYLNELDKDLGLQSLGAMVVPSADGTNYTKIEGLASFVSESLYMLSAMSVNTSQTHTGVLKCIALLQENLKALGVPTQLKALEVDMGEDNPYKLPYAGLQSDSPSLTDLLMLLASNVSVIVASLQYFQFEPEQEDS